MRDLADRLEHLAVCLVLEGRDRDGALALGLVRRLSLGGPAPDAARDLAARLCRAGRDADSALVLEAIEALSCTCTGPETWNETPGLPDAVRVWTCAHGRSFVWGEGWERTAGRLEAVL